MVAAPPRRFRRERGKRPGIRRKRRKIKFPGAMFLEPDYVPLVKLFAVTADESVAMLRDIERCLQGGRHAVCQLLGVPGVVLNKWLYCERGTTAAPRRLIWFAWLMVCRPDAFPLTFWEIALTGRTTSRGADPATAGDRIPTEPRLCDEEVRRLKRFERERKQRLAALERLGGVAAKWMDGGPDI